MPTPAWPLQTQRLVLRPFAADDLAPLHAMHSDEGVARWLYNDPRSLEETRELLARKVTGASVGGEGEWLGAAAVLRETGELVADLALLWASEAHRQVSSVSSFTRPIRDRGTRPRHPDRCSRSPSRRSVCIASSAASSRGTPAPPAYGRSSACGARVTSSRTNG